MAELQHTLAAIPGGGLTRHYGTAHFDGTKWFANLGGNLVTCRWQDPTIPTQGQQIVVDLAKDDRGQSSALVIGAYADQPRPATGTILTMTPEVVVAGAWGGSVVAARVLGTYNIGDNVQLLWDSPQPTVAALSPVLVLPPAANPPAPPSSGAIAGTHRAPATRSNTYWGPGGWGSYATSQRGGEDLYTGSYTSGAVIGAWFYGPRNTVLAGRAVGQMRLRIPARLNAGAYNSPVTLYLYAHTSSAQPGGDVNRTVGPFAVTIPARYTPDMILDPAAPAGHVILPGSFHSVAVAGGGISIAGGTYAGFTGRLKDADSGKLETDWMN